VLPDLGTHTALSPVKFLLDKPERRLSLHRYESRSGLLRSENEFPSNQQKTGCDHGSFDWNIRHRAGAVSSSPEFVFLNVFLINQPEVMIGNAAERFCRAGEPYG
jgi:hypothetical protein